VTAGRSCGVCSKAGGGFLGLRVAGRWSELPERFRRYLWHCADPACIAAAEARRAKAVGVAPAPPPRPLLPKPPASHPVQPNLFGV
jgi:hypothetical protein